MQKLSKKKSNFLNFAGKLFYEQKLIKTDYPLYSEASIIHMDNEFFDKKPSPSSDLQNRSILTPIISAGVYLGNTIIENFGGTWNADDDNDDSDIIKFYVTIPSLKTNFWPIKRVISRFLNGEEDSLVAPYAVIKGLAAGVLIYNDDLKIINKN